MTVVLRSFKQFLLLLPVFLQMFNVLCVLTSELKRRLKAEKKAADKEAKIKEQPAQEACKDEETLDPNVSYLYAFIPN